MTEELAEVSTGQRNEVRRLLGEVEQRLGAELDPSLVIRTLSALLANRVWPEEVDAVVAGLPSLTRLPRAKPQDLENPDDYLYLSLPDEVLTQPIEWLNFTTLIYNCLKKEGVNTIGDLLEWSEADLLNVRHLGRSRLDEVKTKIEGEGWHLSSHDRQDLAPPPGDRWVYLSGRTRLLSRAMNDPVSAVIYGGEIGWDLLTCLNQFGIRTIGQLLQHSVNDLSRLPWSECKLTRDKPGSTWLDPDKEDYTLNPADAVETILEALEARGLATSS